MNRSRDKFQEFVADTERRRLFERESLAFDAVEMISHLMSEARVSKAELARRVGKSRSEITQILSGSRNLTLHTLADLALALGFRLEFKARSSPQPDESHRTDSQTYRLYRFPERCKGTYVREKVEPARQRSLYPNVGA